MSTVTIDGVHFKHGLSATDLKVVRQRIETARKITAGLSGGLRTATLAGDKALEAIFLKQILTRPEPRLASCIEANKRLRPDKRAVLESCLATASTIKLGEPLGEEVLVRGKKKSSGGIRPYCEFRLGHKTRQHLIARVIGEYLKPRLFQYTFLGPHRAIKQAKQYINSGYTHAARLDIRSFFASFDLDQLAHELPFSKETVEYAVVGRHMKAVMDPEKWGHAPYHTLPHTHVDLLLQARQGIPTGAISSPCIGGICISRLACSSCEEAMLLNYADDFLILATSKAALQKKIKELTSATQHLPGGHFDIKLLSDGPLKHGVDFLGHNLSVKKGKAVTLVSEGNVEKMYGDIYQLELVLSKKAYLVGHKDVSASIQCLARMHGLIIAWNQAFREADDVKEHAFIFHSSLNDHALSLGISHDQLQAAASNAGASFRAYGINL